MKMWEEVSGSEQSTARVTGFPLMQTCNLHGVYLSFLGASGKYTGCSHCAGGTTGKSLLSIGEIGLDSLSFTADIPESLLDASFSSFRPMVTSHAVMLTYVQSITKQWVAGHSGECGQLVFLGASQSGKSHVALSVLRTLSIAHSVFYADASRGAFAVPDDCYLLVLDNLFCRGQEAPPKVKSHWNRVLYKRAAVQLPTIIISDQTGAQFRPFLTPRTLHWMRLNKTKVINFEAS